MHWIKLEFPRNLTEKDILLQEIPIQQPIILAQKSKEPGNPMYKNKYIVASLISIDLNRNEFKWDFGSMVTKNTITNNNIITPIIFPNFYPTHYCIPDKL